MTVDNNSFPRHKFWGAGEPDCPQDIKASNGELHTMRCKVCGDGWRKSVDVCFVALSAKAMPITPDLHRVWNTLMFFAHPDSYTMGERTGGVLQGCPRAAPPTPDEMAGYAKTALASLCKAVGREPEEWMLAGGDQKAAPLHPSPTDEQVTVALRAACLHDTPESRKDMRKALIAALSLHPSSVQAVDGDENAKLRQLLCDVLTALGNGSGASPVCSMEFLSHIPEEVRLCVADLRAAMKDKGHDPA